MRIAICDDEKKICDILYEKIKEFCPDAEAVIYTSGTSLLASDPLPDILLLDIKMPDMDGMIVAHSLRDGGWKIILIFITGEEDKVWDSFDLHAFHFLVKPVSDGKLKAVLKDAINGLKNMPDQTTKNDRHISIKSGTSHIRIDLSKLLYAEVYDRKTILHTERENIEYYGQLSALEELVGDDFCRIHRSYLVNGINPVTADKATFAPTSVNVASDGITPSAEPAKPFGAKVDVKA